MENNFLQLFAYDPTFFTPGNLPCCLGYVLSSPSADSSITKRTVSSVYFDGRVINGYRCAESGKITQ